jgi:dihydroorotate dehydrogenase electron transfer subunit
MRSTISMITVWLIPIFPRAPASASLPYGRFFTLWGQKSAEGRRSRPPGERPTQPAPRLSVMTKTSSQGDPVEPLIPPQAAQRTVAILENERIARATYRMRLDDPEMARRIRPGQFLMVRPGLEWDPLLGRPFALYDVARDGSGRPVAIDIVYLVLGRGTAAMARRSPGDRVVVWGPLGNGFGAPPEGDVVFVAGGIGQTPFLALGRWWLGRASYGEGPSWEGRCATSATLLYGVRDASLAAGIADFEAAGIAVELATDDGSAGHRGFVTDLLARRLERGERPAKVVGCGPPAMLKTLTEMVERSAIACDLSLENHMACGFGACFSCVAPIRQHDGSIDLRRVCVEGPVFPADEVAW